MPRCEFKHPNFGLSGVYLGDGSGQCWLTDVANFGTEKTPQYICVFHSPKGTVPADRPEWSPKQIGSVQSRQLLRLLTDWNSENDLKQTNHRVAFVLPGLRCGEFRCPPSYIFSGPINLNGAKFYGVVKFSGAVFENHAYFEDVDFNGMVCIDSTTFAGNVTFARARFHQDAQFDHSQFIGPASFWGTEFKKDCNFRSVPVRRSKLNDSRPILFHRTANFADAFFKGYTDFSYVTFVESASFSRARFEGDDAIFMGSRFKTHANFDSAVFERRVFFDGACFRNLALFQSVRFNDVLTARKTNFFGEFKFLMCELRYPSSLIDCHIHQFRYSNHLGARLTFNRCRAFDRNRKTPGRKLGFWNFQDADCTEISFVNISDMSKVDFLGANVRKTELVSCGLLGKPYSKVYGHDEIIEKYRNGDSRELGLLRALYRQLKVNLEENHEFAAAGDYHYQEMEIRRLLAEDRNNRLEAWILSVYKRVGDYGESYLKLGAWLIGSFALTATFISFMSFFEQISNGKFRSMLLNIQASGYEHAFSIFCENVNGSFFTLTPSALQREAAKRYIDYLSSWDKVAIVVEGIVLLILATLFVMAVRRRFRR